MFLSFLNLWHQNCTDQTDLLQSLMIGSDTSHKSKGDFFKIGSEIKNLWLFHLKLCGAY